LSGKTWGAFRTPLPLPMRAYTYILVSFADW
jgi:hypothetical protein